MEDCGGWASYSNFHPAGGPPGPCPARIFLSFLAPGAGAAACDEVPTSLSVRLLIDLCPPEPNPGPNPHTLQPDTAGRQTIKAIRLPLRLDLAEIVVHPGFPIPTRFHFWLGGGFIEQGVKFLGRRAVFDVRVVVRGKVFVVGDSGSGVGVGDSLCLRATLPCG